MFVHGSWFMALAIPAQHGFAYDSWLSAHGSWPLHVALRLLKMAIGVSLAPFSFLLSHRVLRSSPPISWKSASAASAHGVRHSYLWCSLQACCSLHFSSLIPLPPFFAFLFWCRCLPPFLSLSLSSLRTPTPCDQACTCQFWCKLLFSPTVTSLALRVGAYNRKFEVRNDAPCVIHHYQPSQAP